MSFFVDARVRWRTLTEQPVAAARGEKLAFVVAPSVALRRIPFVAARDAVAVTTKMSHGRDDAVDPSVRSTRRRSAERRRAREGGAELERTSGRPVISRLDRTRKTTWWRINELHVVYTAS